MHLNRRDISSYHVVNQIHALLGYPKKLYKWNRHKSPSVPAGTLEYHVRKRASKALATVVTVVPGPPENPWKLTVTDMSRQRLRVREIQGVPPLNLTVSVDHVS